MNNSARLGRISRKTAFTVPEWLLPLLVILPFTGSASAADVRGESSDITVTARITTCQPQITLTDYAVAVKPSDGRAEGDEFSGTTYFPDQVATIDNSKCGYGVDITGETDGQASNPGVHLNDIGASISINSKEGKSGGWTKTEGASVATLTIQGGAIQPLYAGINPWTANTAYITGSQEGTITLTLTPH